MESVFKSVQYRYLGFVYTVSFQILIRSRKCESGSWLFKLGSCTFHVETTSKIIQPKFFWFRFCIKRIWIWIKLGRILNDLLDCVTDPDLKDLNHLAESGYEFCPTYNRIQALARMLNIKNGMIILSQDGCERGGWWWAFAALADFWAGVLASVGQQPPSTDAAPPSSGPLQVNT